MDFGDYAYLIFLILGAIFSAFNKKKKKKVAKPAASEKSERPAKSPISEIFDTLSNNIEAQFDVEHNSREEIEIERVKPQRRKPVQKTIEQVIEKKSPKKVDLKEKKKPTIVEDLESERPEFNLRQAVIQSAILNRPYE